MTMRSAVLLVVALCSGAMLDGCQRVAPADHTGTSDSAASKLAPAAPAVAPAPQIAKTVPPVPVAARRQSDEEGMIDPDTEGGTRGGSYPLWVHATLAGKPVSAAVVAAFDDKEHKVSAVKSGDDGYARLLLPGEGSYKITAVGAGQSGELTVNFTPTHGDVEIELSSRTH